MHCKKYHIKIKMERGKESITHCHSTEKKNYESKLIAIQKFLMLEDNTLRTNPSSKEFTNMQSTITKTLKRKF